MQLKDLFEPDQFGNIPMWVTKGGFVIEPSHIPGIYKLGTHISDDHYPETAYVKFTSPKNDVVRLYRDDGLDNFIVLARLYVVPATAENILLTQTLKGSIHD